MGVIETGLNFRGLMNVHYMPRKNGQIVYKIEKCTRFAVNLRADSVREAGAAGDSVATS